MESLENSKILKLLGLDDKNKWVLQDEKAQKFLEYIASNLDETNILTDSEIQEYEDLKSAGLVLEGDELENELKNIEINFPGFFSVTEQQIEELEEQIRQLEDETSERTDRVARMQECEEEQLKKIARIESESQETMVQQLLYAEQCLEKSRELASLQKSNSDKIIQLNQIYVTPVRLKCLESFLFSCLFLFSKSHRR
jgi:chromosome segregation ATPase